LPNSLLINIRIKVMVHGCPHKGLGYSWLIAQRA
jgi:hypothetical protein